MRSFERMLEQTALSDRADDELGTLSGGNKQRVNIAIGLLSDPPVLLLDEPSSSLDPRQRERLWQFVGGLAESGTSVIFSTHNVQEAERYADRVLVLADGELLFLGTPRGLEETVGGDRPRLRGGVRPLPPRPRALTVRWLLLKDLQILRRSPLLVGLLVDLPDRDLGARSASRSRAARRSRRSRSSTLVKPSDNTLSLGGEKIDASKYANELFKSIDPIRVKTRAEAIQKVKSGEALAALVVPADITRKLQRRALVGAASRSSTTATTLKQQPRRDHDQQRSSPRRNAALAGKLRGGRRQATSTCC